MRANQNFRNGRLRLMRSAGVSVASIGPGAGRPFLRVPEVCGLEAWWSRGDLNP
jgi:hypothetical protein